MSKVFVINSYNNQIDQASRFGEIVEITKGMINPFSIDRLAWSMAPSLNSFMPDDYLLLTGPGSGYILATIMLLGRGITRIKCLRYETNTRQYEEVVIDLSSVMNQLSSRTPLGTGKIFVINYSGHSIEPALQMSNLPKEDKLCIITHGNLDQNNLEPLLSRVVGVMGKFGRGDMLLLSGPAILHIICAAVLFLNKDPFSILIYNPKYRTYIKREVDVRHLIEVMVLAANEKIVA